MKLYVGSSPCVRVYVVYSVVALLERETQHGDGEHVYKCASHYVAIWE